MKPKISRVVLWLLARPYSAGAFVGPRNSLVLLGARAQLRLRAQPEPNDPLREPLAVREDVNELIKKGQEKVTGKSLETAKRGLGPLARFGPFGKLGAARRDGPVVTAEHKEHKSVSDLIEWKQLETNAKHIKV